MLPARALLQFWQTSALLAGVGMLDAGCKYFQLQSMAVDVRCLNTIVTGVFPFPCCLQHFYAHPNPGSLSQEDGRADQYGVDVPICIRSLLFQVL